MSELDTGPDESLNSAAGGSSIFSRDSNYVRDAILFWPFVISSTAAVFWAFSPDARRLALGCAILAILAFLLAKEKLLLLFVALGFCAIQGLIWLIIRPWRWGMFVATILTGVPFLIANRVWREPKLSYRLPKALGSVDVLLGVASISATIFLFWAIARFT